MESSSPWSITVSKQVTEGYDHTLCVECTITTGGGQTMTIDNWNIKQHAQCSSTLTAPSAVIDVNMEYDVAISSQPIAPSDSFTTWDAFFSNTDTTDCPITSCTISFSGNCGVSDFTGTDHVVFDTASPWGITIPLNSETGFTYVVCI